MRATINFPKIYIILPVHNRIEITSRFVRCLKSQTYTNFQLILVDDGSTDGTANYVRNELYDATIIKGNGNLWWAGALNKAYKHLCRSAASNMDIVWINNDDTLLDRNYFEKVVTDPFLDARTLVISPGQSLYTDFLERGFSADWSTLRLQQITEGEAPDALTTRGLYMHFATYKALGPMHAWLLPHYLSDLEYTIRAERRGFRLSVSKTTKIYVDREETGIHLDPSQTVLDFLYNHFISKKTAFNTFYWGNFVLLASPPGCKVVNLLRVYVRLFRKLKSFLAARSIVQEVSDDPSRS